MSNEQMYQLKNNPASGPFRARLFDGTLESASAFYRWSYGKGIDGARKQLVVEEGIMIFECSGGYKHKAHKNDIILKGQGPNFGGVMFAMPKDIFDIRCEPVEAPKPVGLSGV